MKLTRFLGWDPQAPASRYACTDEAEKRLMFAILEDAIRCFQNVSLETRLKRFAIDEAEEWLMEDATGVFSFRSVCAVLGIDADFLRAGLIEWRARGGRLASQKTFDAELRSREMRIIGNRTRGLPSGRDPQAGRLL
jgi:hypothetical protein